MSKKNWIFFLFLISFCILILIGLSVVLYSDYFKWNTAGDYENPNLEKNDDESPFENMLTHEGDASDDTEIAEELENGEKGKDEEKREQRAFADSDLKKREKVIVTNKTSSHKSRVKNTKVKKTFTRVSNSKSTTYSSLDHESAYSYLEQSFDSLGEYVSSSERAYRQQLIGSLDIHTIVIDCLSEKNGISQEFFKIVYLRKMIPAKILEKVVESKEFRTLIPPDYLVREQALGRLKNGDFVVFRKSELKRLLDIWCHGQLTPVRKAWTVGAEK